MTEISPIDFGKLQERVQQLSTSVEELSKSVQILSAALTEAKGGWKVLAFIGAGVLTVSGGISWLVAHIHFTP